MATITPGPMSRMSKARSIRGISCLTISKVVCAVAPMGFIEDVSHYCLMTPEPMTAGGASSDLPGWLWAIT